MDYRGNSARGFAALLALGMMVSAPVGHAQQPAAADEQLDITPQRDTYRGRTAMPGHQDTGDVGAAYSFDFNELDANSNDVITPAEAKADTFLSEVFSQVDENQDQKISPAEFAAFETLRMQRQRQPAQEQPPQRDAQQQNSGAQPAQQQQGSPGAAAPR